MFDSDSITSRSLMGNLNGMPVGDLGMLHYSCKADDMIFICPAMITSKADSSSTALTKWLHNLLSSNAKKNSVLLVS